MSVNCSDSDCAAPTHATIRRLKGQDTAFKAIIYRDDDSATRLHEGLSTDDTGTVGCRLWCSPCLATIGRGAHLHEVAETMVIKLRITVTVEGAAGRIVADSPVLVVEMT